jgi:hypothetical protein
MTMNRRTSWATGIALALLAISLGAACGGKKDDKAATATTGKAAVAIDNAASPAAGKGTASTKAGDAGDFAALFGRAKTAESRVDYTIAMTGAGAMNGTMTMRRLAGRTRIDIASAQGSLILIQAPDKTLMCIAEQQVCLDAGAGVPGMANNPLLTQVQSFDPSGAGYTNRELDRRRIAGIEGRCFESTSPQAQKSTTCVGPDGQLLLAEFSGSGTSTTMTATKVEGKPPTTDFDPPYPVTSLPGLGGFTPQPGY